MKNETWRRDYLVGEDENQEASEEAQEMNIVRKKRTKQEMKMKKKESIRREVEGE